MGGRGREGGVGGSCQFPGAPELISALLGRSVRILYSGGLFFLYEPGQTLTGWSLCQLSCTNGGEGKRVWLLLKLTDCLHLLSELCHMLECTTWLLLGRGGSHSCPFIILCSCGPPPNMYSSNSNINQDTTTTRDRLQHLL